MRKKSGLTILEQAIVRVPEFENVVHKLDQQVELRGQSKSTLKNYSRRIALFVIHFGKLPEQIDPSLKFMPEEKPGIDDIVKRKQPPETNLQRLERLTGINPCICPVCKKGNMILIKILLRIRSPGKLIELPSLATS